MEIQFCHTGGCLCLVVWCCGGEIVMPQWPSSELNIAWSITSEQLVSITVHIRHDTLRLASRNDKGAVMMWLFITDS